MAQRRSHVARAPRSRSRCRATSRSSWTATGGGRSGAGLKRTEGHAAGEEALFDTVEGALEIGLEWMTVYAFSTENWRRPLDEVRFLMNFNERLLVARRDELNGKGVRVRFIGRRDGPGAGPGAAAHRGDRGADRTQPPADAHLRVQLRRPGRARRRACARSRGGRGAARLDPERDRRAHDRTGTSTRPTCPTPTCSCARRASTGSRTTCCGSSRTPSCVFTDVLWPDFRREHLFDAIARVPAPRTPLRRV